MDRISSLDTPEVSESLVDAVGRARNRIFDQYPHVQTVHFWVNSQTQRVRCEIALPKPGIEQNEKPSIQIITGIIDELIVPTLPPQKKILTPVVILNIGVPTDISPVVSPIDKLATGVGVLLKKLVPPSRENGNNS